MSEKESVRLAAFMLGLGFLLGMVFTIVVSNLPTETTSQTTTVVNCNNMSANDGGTSPERDITAEEFKKFCE